MLALRPDLTAVLRRAREATDHAPVDWLDAQPVGAHSLHRALGLSGSAEVGHCGRALLDWDLHRGAGFTYAAFWGSRLAPFAARRVQSAITGRYLATAAAIAGRP